MAPLTARGVLLAIAAWALARGAGGAIVPSSVPGDGAHAIFAMACAYSARHVRHFLLSLRASGYRGATHFGVEPGLDGETARYLARFGVTTDTAPCERIPFDRRGGAGGAPSSLWLGALNTRRYLHYLRWLGAPPSRYERVWLLDVRDVVFLRHPFALPPSLPPLSLFSEMPQITVWVQSRLTKCVSARAAKNMTRALRFNLCAGTVVGSAEGVRRLCVAMAALEHQMWAAHPHEAVCHHNDQPLLNFLMHAHGIRTAGVYADADGGGAEGSEEAGVPRTRAPDGWAQFGLVPRASAPPIPQPPAGALRAGLLPAGGPSALGRVQVHDVFSGPALSLRTPRLCEVFEKELRQRRNRTAGTLLVLHKWDKCAGARALVEAELRPLLQADAREQQAHGSSLGRRQQR